VRLWSCLRAGLRDFGAEPRERFIGSLFPVGAAEALRCDGVPADRFVVARSLFFDRRKFPGDHRVVRALEELGKLCRWIGCVFGFADPRLNLPPISHGAILYQRVQT